MATSAGAHADGTVRIGWLSSLTGPLSSSAIAENQGVLHELTSRTRYPFAFQIINTNT